MKRRQQHQIMVRDPVLCDITERWRYLLPVQREAVIAALMREEKRLMRWARRERAKRSRPAPFGNFKMKMSLQHAAKAGAVLIAREMLERIGGHPE